MLPGRKKKPGTPLRLCPVIFQRRHLPGYPASAIASALRRLPALTASPVGLGSLNYLIVSHGDAAAVLASTDLSPAGSLTP